ncbi:MAG: hypothetical protein ACRYFR_09245 [Janthinobacterium lividum]
MRCPARRDGTCPILLQVIVGAEVWPRSLALSWPELLFDEARGECLAALPAAARPPHYPQVLALATHLVGGTTKGLAQRASNHTTRRWATCAMPRRKKSRPAFITILGPAPLAVRYWFRPEGASSLHSSLDYAVLGSNNVNVTFGQAGTETYAEIRFNPALGSRAPRSTTGNVQYCLNKDDWSFFAQANDFSFLPFSLEFAANDHMTVYQKDRLVYGQEPAGAAGAAAALARRGPQAKALAAPAVAQAVSSYPNPFTGATTLAFFNTRSLITRSMHTMALAA